MLTTKKKHLTLISKHTHRRTVNWQKKILYKNGKQEQRRIAISISGKTDFKSEAVKPEEGYYVTIEGPIQQEEQS